MDRSAGVRARKQLPNMLSLSRILLGAVFFVLLRRAEVVSTGVCLALIGAGMLTDYLDGKLARRNNLVSTAGKWIDPVSDFIFFFFVYLSFYVISLMPLVLLVLFLLREIGMYAVVRPLYVVRKMDPAAKKPGKVKTALQNAGSAVITALILLHRFQLLNFAVLKAVSVPLLSVMVAVSLISTYWYIRPLVPGRGSRDRG